MAIETLDAAIAGFRQPRPVMKAGVTMAAAGGYRGYTPWYAAGNPGGGAANGSGVNGAVVSGDVAGAIPRTNPTGGQHAHLGRLTMQSSVNGSLWLIDRLWHNSGLTVTSTAGQAITTPTLPPRDLNGATNGAAVMAAIEWSTAGGAGTPTVTLRYNDQDGNAGVGTFAAVASPPVGTFEIFNLGAGDTGIRSLTAADAFQQSATRTSGTMHLVLFRVLAHMECSAPNVAGAIDFLTAGKPRIYDDSVLQLVWFPTATTAVNLIGSYIETHG